MLDSAKARRQHGESNAKMAPTIVNTVGILQHPFRAVRSAIALRLVARSSVKLIAVTVTSPTQLGCSLVIQLAVTRCGPFAATINFPTGLEILTQPDHRSSQLLTSPDGIARLSDKKHISDAETKSRKDPIVVAKAGPGQVQGEIKISNGVGFGTIIAQVVWQGCAGLDWLTQVKTVSGLMEDYISCHILLTAKRAAILPSMTVVIYKRFQFEGLSGLKGADTHHSTLLLLDMRTEPLKTGKDGVFLSGNLRITNPSHIIGLDLGPIKVRLEALDHVGIVVGTARILSFELPPQSTRKLALSTRISFTIVAEILGRNIVPRVFGHKGPGLRLAIMGENRENPSQELYWLNNLLNRVPLFIEIPDPAKLIHGTLLSVDWT